MEKKKFEYRQAQSAHIIENRITEILKEKGKDHKWLQKEAKISWDLVKWYINNQTQPRSANMVKVAKALDRHPSEIWYLIPGNEKFTLTFEYFNQNVLSNNEVQLNRIKAYMEEKFPEVTSKFLWLSMHTKLPQGRIKHILCNSFQPKGEMLIKIAEVLKVDPKDLIYMGKVNSIRGILKEQKITPHMLVKKTNIEYLRIRQICNNEVQPSKEEGILIAKALKVLVMKLNIPEEVETTEIISTEEPEIEDIPLKQRMTDEEVQANTPEQKELDFKIPEKEEKRIILKVPEKDLPDECIDIRLASKAKEAGYNEECDNAWRWHGNSPKPTKMTLGNTPKNWNDEKKLPNYYYSAPTQKRLMIWLKETRRISVDYVKISDEKYQYIIGAAFNLFDTDERVLISNGVFMDHTEAMEEGLSKAINAL